MRVTYRNEPDAPLPHDRYGVDYVRQADNGLFFIFEEEPSLLDRLLGREPEETEHFIAGAVLVGVAN